MIILDKTGTVSADKMTLADVIIAGSTDRTTLLYCTGALEDTSQEFHR
ncbi:hypothetical protein [Mycobacterium uberis]|nr:hypothetical protein [Mycobacterium uberis]